MLRKFVSLCLCALLAAGLPAGADLARRPLPELSGYTLDGHRRSLPGDLGAPATLLIVSFESLAAEEVASWRSLAGQVAADLPVLPVVLMDERGPRARAFAAGRLRGDVSDPSDRAQTIAVFSDIAQFRRDTGIAGHSGIVALLVSEDGSILWDTSGSATQDAGTELAAAPGAGQAQPALPKAPAALVQADARSASQDAQAPPKPGAYPALEQQQEAAPADGKAPAAADPVFPIVEAYTLAGDRLTIPGDLASANTRLYILRRGDGISKVSEQVETIAAGQRTDDDWLVLVYMGKAPKPGRAFAAGSLRREIVDAALRKHIVPVFSDLATLEAELGFVLPALDAPACIHPGGALCTQVALKIRQ